MNIHEFQRNPWYYVTNMVIPAVLISLLTPLVFILPTEASEKISLIITVSLSYLVLMVMVADITPRNGVHIPLICELPLALRPALYFDVIWGRTVVIHCTEYAT